MTYSEHPGFPANLEMTGAEEKVVTDAVPVIVELAYQAATAGRYLAGHPTAVDPKGWAG